MVRLLDEDMIPNESEGERAVCILEVVVGDGAVYSLNGLVTVGYRMCHGAGAALYATFRLPGGRKIETVGVIPIQHGRIFVTWVMN